MKTPKKSSDYYTPVGPVYDNSVIRWLEAKSKENMALFHLKELQRIHLQRSSRGIETRTVSTLVKNELVVRVWGGKGGTYHYLTPYSVNVLRDLELLKMSENSPIGHNESAPMGLPVPQGESSVITIKGVENK